MQKEEGSLGLFGVDWGRFGGLEGRTGQVEEDGFRENWGNKEGLVLLGNGRKVGLETFEGRLKGV